ncbi:Amidohydrolase 3 [Thermaerobacter marianensis DSM 12885]|uniref:Amidohydrolase 3 n=1 Tax=Thermaerobacter marianensis (strain ATCC 700841 / DSM 12885 / JCM 10246 / 7p75a) TaxID=644966 RepID=E6SIQ5_THEM7|nr:amidohydrolase [Thermaerobacter marianensis]ADU51999.1 Amidohydrolase 3 [Thermaerobacter marianensis DSM 12885]
MNQSNGPAPAGGTARPRYFFNGRIFTADPQQPEATAMVVEGGRIRWIGRQEDANPGAGVERLDLAGHRVIPGLIDAHMHPLFLAETAQQIPCLPPAARSIGDIVAAVRRRREELGRAGATGPGPAGFRTGGPRAAGGGMGATGRGTDPAAEPSRKPRAASGTHGLPWILGWGYDEGKLAEGRAPTRWDLDRGAADVPVVITRICYHVVAVNSKALELAGITRDTPDPPGGRIDRDERGEPTGVLREAARYLVLDLIPMPSPEAQAEMLAKLSPLLLARGITAITDMMARRRPVDDLTLYRAARGRGLRQRAVLYYLWEHLREELPGEAAGTGGRPLALEPGATDLRQPVFVGGIKVFADGSISGRTAWVDPPFGGVDPPFRGTGGSGSGEAGAAGSPAHPGPGVPAGSFAPTGLAAPSGAAGSSGVPGQHGLALTTPDELRAAAAVARRAGVQLAVHAMGNRAVDLVVGTLGALPGWLRDGPSVRLEHATLASRDAMARAARAGIAFVPQPIFLFAEIESYLNNLGVERARRAYALRSMLEAGVTVALSSDAPATSWADPASPFVNMKAAATRVASSGTPVGLNEAIPVAVALALYTREAARVTRIPGVGQLKPGYAADFVVLDRDLLSVEPADLDAVRVVATYMGGERVYPA